MRRNRSGISTEMKTDMTPMIDMVFQLIIFFIVVLDFTQKDLEDLDPPSVRNGAVEDKPDPERLLINVTRYGEIVSKGDTLFLPNPARITIERTKHGQKKIERLERRLQDLPERFTLQDLEKPARLMKKMADYALEMQRLDEREGLKPDNSEARIQYLDVVAKAVGSGPAEMNQLKVVKKPVLIRADRYTPFYAINDVLTMGLPSADPLYAKKNPADRDPPFPFQIFELSTKLDEEEAARLAAQESKSSNQ
ncbi:MAG: biopolymer transporter ExbD [Planctomycetes bacterium]|nr:biopolymer transporter ExbD [Planctomycetota bacterium]